jgi:hypothetical protein
MWKTLVVAAALAACSGAHAQTKKELAQKVVQLQQQGIESVGHNLAAQTSAQILQAAGQALDRVPQAKREATAKEIQGDVRAFHDQIEPVLRERASKLAPAAIGGVLEERFSEDELKQLVAWLESPVSKKYEQLAPELQQSLTQKIVADTRPTVEPKLKALEQTIAKRLGAPAAAASAAPASAPAKKR